MAIFDQKSEFPTLISAGIQAVTVLQCNMARKWIAGQEINYISCCLSKIWKHQLFEKKTSIKRPNFVENFLILGNTSFSLLYDHKQARKLKASQEIKSWLGIKFQAVWPEILNWPVKTFQLYQNIWNSTRKFHAH